MACIAETLGMSLPGTAAIPAVHADRLRAAEASGAHAVRLIQNPIRPSQVITTKSVHNALRVLLALGGSTNAIIHLTAIAGRRGIPISLHDLNELSDTTPVLVDLKPTGDNYMEDFYAAGGMSALLRELKPLLHLDTISVTGETLGERLAAEEGAWADHRVVRKASDPIEPVGGLVALFGSLAPGGAILKRSAADKTLFEKEARAVVFTSLQDLSERVDDPDLDIQADDIMVLQNAGPTSGSGMPYVGRANTNPCASASHRQCRQPDIASHIRWNAENRSAAPPDTLLSPNAHQKSTPCETASLVGSFWVRAYRTMPAVLDLFHRF
jgi:dihydroxy-acid dehydratase